MNEKNSESKILKKVLNDRIENINVILTRCGGSEEIVQEKEVLKNIVENINSIKSK